jgi:outer membrane protein assembly complex protein YaeT
LLQVEFAKKIPVLTVFLLLIIPMTVPAYDEEFRFKARNVDFAGFKNVEPENFEELLITQSPPFWKFWKPHVAVTPADLEEDLLKIKQYCRTQGYYHARVLYEMELVKPSAAAENDDDGNRRSAPPDTPEEEESLDEYNITFRVIEGPPVVVRNIDIDGISGIDLISENGIIEALPLQQHKTFRSEDYDDAKFILKKELGNNSYPFAEVKGRAVVDLNENVADILFDVKPGDTYYFGKLRMTGHEDFISPTVIERAMTFKPGERFSTKKIRESRINLFDLNVFQTAVVDTGEPDTLNRIVPIDIQVKPRKRQSVTLGVGYGTEDKLRLQGGWAYRNVTGNADRISLSAKSSDLKQAVSGEYQYPYFLSSRNNLVADSGFEREKSDYYTLRNVYTRANIYRKLTTNWTSNVGYNLEINRPEDIKVGYEDEVQNDINEENYRVSALLVGIERNTLDDDLNPKHGTVLSVSFESATDYIGSEISYIKPVTEAKIFTPIVDDLIFGGRARFITIQAIYDTEDIPIYRQLFLGGSKTVRGYDYQKLGVIDEDDQLVSVGGQSSFIGSMELRYPLYKDFSGVAFLDMGVMDTEAYRCDFGNMRYTCGVGFRYDTVIGPIQLDAGYKLNPPEKTDGEGTDVTEEPDTDRWRFYLNIGHAF